MVKEGLGKKILNFSLKPLKKYGGLAALVGLGTPIHETIHGVTAVATGGVWEGVELNSAHWYSRPLEWLTLGFYDAKELGRGAGGVAYTNHNELIQEGHVVLAKIGSILTSATPEFFYTTIGMGLVTSGVSEYKTKPATGFAKTIAGGLCMSNTLNYARICIQYGAQPGHDYYNVTQGILSLTPLPETWASWTTPLIGIPLLFFAAYQTAGFVSEKISNFRQRRKEKKEAKKMITYNK